MFMIEKYRLAFEISPVPMLLASDTGEILLANSGLDELFEYETGDLVGQNVEILVPESTRGHHPELRAAYARVPTKRNMGAGRDLNGVTRLGNIIPLELGLEPVVDGERIMALVAAIDIRQRKTHEVRLLQAMDAAASAMVMVDETGHIVFVNKSAVSLFGYEETDLLGAPVELLIPEEFHRAHPVYLGSYMSASTVRSMGLGRDLFARHRTGRRIPVEISLTPVDSPEGNMVMSTIIDLSERVAAAEAMARKSAELEALNTELSHFAYSASHDLKAPLSSITGLLNLCVEDFDDGNHDEVRRNLKKATEISARSARKIEGILKIARAGRDVIPAEPVDLNLVFQEAWEDLAGSNSHAAELAVTADDVARVVVEVPTLKIILENILSNALRYRDADKADHVIRAECTLGGGMLNMTIADNGIGIPAANQAEVFTMFKRIDERSGDGLGLTLVRKQLDRLGGAISFSSKQGEGTAFMVRMPVGVDTHAEH